MMTALGRVSWRSNRLVVPRAVDPYTPQRLRLSLVMDRFLAFTAAGLSQQLTFRPTLASLSCQALAFEGQVQQHVFSGEQAANGANGVDRLLLLL